MALSAQFENTTSRCRLEPTTFCVQSFVQQWVVSQSFGSEQSAFAKYGNGTNQSNRFGKEMLLPHYSGQGTIT